MAQPFTKLHLQLPHTEAQLQQLLVGKQTPATLVSTLQSVYASHGRTAQCTDTDGEF